MPNNCQTGCKYFSGGEVKHHPHCVNYPESLSKMYDELQAENARLREVLQAIASGTHIYDKYRNRVYSKDVARAALNNKEGA